MADAVDAAEPLDVGVDQPALALAATSWHARLESGEAAETMTAQHGADHGQRAGGAGARWPGWSCVDIGALRFRPRLHDQADAGCGGGMRTD